MHPAQDDTFSFTIPFTESDLGGAVSKEFTYQVTESGQIRDVINDSGEHTLTVRVTDNGVGTMKLEVIKEPQALEFVNMAGVKMPATGSTTAIWTSLAGLAVAAAGAAIVLKKRKAHEN